MKRRHVRSTAPRSFGLGVRVEFLERRQLLSAAVDSRGSEIVTLFQAPRSAAELVAPSINRTDPADGATGVRRDTSVIAYPNLPNPNGVIDPASLSSSFCTKCNTSGSSFASVARSRCNIPAYPIADFADRRLDAREPLLARVFRT